jgi:hypothetical protein
MPYGDVTTHRDGNRLIIVVDLPAEGELSKRGLAENLIVPNSWVHHEDDSDFLSINMTVCRPLYRSHPRPCGRRVY